MTESPPIVLVEYFSEHWYKIVKEDQTFFFASVTTKLKIKSKEGLNKWRGDIGNREADLRMHEAGDRGKRIHWAREVMLKGGAIIYDPWQNPVYTLEGIAALKKEYSEVAIIRTQDEMYQLSKLKRQLDILKPKILGVEVKVCDFEYRDAGTIDAIYEIEEGEYAISGSKPLYLPAGIYIEDLKSGSYLDDDVWMQPAPYGYMYEKINGLEITGALITHTGSTIKSGIPGLKTLFRDRETLLNKDYVDYRHAAALWERDHADDQPAFYEFPSLLTLKGETNGME